MKRMNTRFRVRKQILSTDSIIHLVYDLEQIFLLVLVLLTVQMG